VLHHLSSTSLLVELDKEYNIRFSFYFFLEKSLTFQKTLQHGKKTCRSKVTKAGKNVINRGKNKQLIIVQKFSTMKINRSKRYGIPRFERIVSNQ